MIEKYTRSLPGSPATVAIIAINIAVFVALNAIPRLADELLLHPELAAILERPWTLVTVAFSHVVHVHLLANMGLLFFFGIEFERITGSRTVFLVYLICGFLGSLTSIPMAALVGWGSEPVVGASAAVWGVIAAFSVMRPDARMLGGKAKLFPIILFIGNAILFVLNPEMSIGAGAHTVGLAVGLVYGYLLKSREPELK